MYRGAGDWGVISDTCISWFLRKAVPFLSTVPDLISYLIFDILISRGRRVDVLTRTVTCKLRTKKRNADETQQWGGETKFYKHRANKLDSECHFFRMVLGRSKSFQSRLLSVSVVTHLYRHHWSSLVQPAASQSLRLPNSSLLYKIQSYSFPDMNFWSFQAFLKFLSVSWDLKKKTHKHWSYADILQSIVSWPFSFMHCIVIFGHKRSLFALLLNRAVLFFLFAWKHGEQCSHLTSSLTKVNWSVKLWIKCTIGHTKLHRCQRGHAGTAGILTQIGQK